MARILVAEDDPRIGRPLRRELSRSGHDVDSAEDGEQAWQYLSSGHYDLLILDLMLPTLPGLELCRRLRRENLALPVLMLTAMATKADTVRGLDAGADDYLTKPFALNELHARVRALLRRTGPLAAAVLEWGDLRLVPAARVVRLGLQEVILTPREAQILERLLACGSNPISSEQLLNRVWGWEAPGRETVKAHIRSLRRKLAEIGRPDLICSAYGRGYWLNPLD